MMNEEESVKAGKGSAFKAWLTHQGGYINPHIAFQAGIVSR